MTNPTLDDFDTDKLGKLDAMGYSWEMANLDLFKHTDGIKVTYNNPEKPRLWKRTKGNGIDKQLEVKNRDNIAFNVFIEESYQSKPYYYRKKWFLKCRLPRFRNIPHGRFITRVILTNRPQNMLSVQTLAKKHHIHIFNLNQLLNYIKHLASTNFFHSKTNTPIELMNKVYAYDSKRLVKEDKASNEELGAPVKPRFEPVHPSALEHPDHKRWFRRQLELAERASEGTI